MAEGPKQRHLQAVGLPYMGPHPHYHIPTPIEHTPTHTPSPPYTHTPLWDFVILGPTPPHTQLPTRNTRGLQDTMPAQTPGRHSPFPLFDWFFPHTYLPHTSVYTHYHTTTHTIHTPPPTCHTAHYTLPTYHTHTHTHTPASYTHTHTHTHSYHGTAHTPFH